MKILNDRDLCKWLRDNSSGAYRPSARAADRIESLTEWIKEHGKQSNTCTKNILGEICDNCQCRK